MRQLKKIACAVAIVAVNFCLFAQKKYEANWESLNSRPVATWFEDAKFGIFIHWGLYSVPAWSPKGTYSEWYQYWLQSQSIGGNGEFTGKEVPDLHTKLYGENFPYHKLASKFTAELWDPDEWATIFSRSGAKYVVLTSKHHEGYCLFDSKSAGKERGYPWTSLEIGPKRDIVKEYVAALRKKSIKAGLYYSIYEWYHPLYNRKDLPRFVDEHLHPQFKELAQNYAPDLIWVDGAWDYSAETWKTPELLAWLFNESPCKDYVVINDRWGKGGRQKNGGYYTTEYESGVAYEHPWEECRGMGFSFGYNRAEGAEDYNSAKALVLMLVDIVSHGGNLLLGIGPRADGKIPPIMEQRLLDIGKWLTINGEAIYNTRQWRTPIQYSEGNRNYKKMGNRYTSGNYILKQTVDVDKGYATKELFFTHKNNTLYAIMPLWKNNVTIKGIQGKSNTKVTLLLNKKNLTWKNVNGNMEVQMPPFDPNTMNGQAAYVLSISGIADYVRKPVIEATTRFFLDNPKVSISTTTPLAAIHYTTDGTTPTTSSPIYKEPFVITSSATIKAKAFAKEMKESTTAEKEITKQQYHRPPMIKGLQRDLTYTLSTGSKGTSSNFSTIVKGETAESFRATFSGYIKITQRGVYTFSVKSDDGSYLYINGELIVDNGGGHSATEKAGHVALYPGFHRIKIDYEQVGGDKELQLFYQRGKGPKTPLNNLFHKP